MATQHFGLESFGSEGRITDNGSKFTLKDRETIDSLLYVLFNHDHRDTAADVVVGPTDTPDLTISTSGGSLAANTTYYYRISFLDAVGNETFASPIAIGTTDAALTAPPVMAIATADTGGTLTAGTYKYALSYTQGTSQTRATNIATISVPTGTSTNQNTLTLDTLPSGADGWKVYRKGPGESTYYLLATVSSGNTEYVDDGTDSPDCTKFRPTVNTTNSTNSITVTIPPPDLPLQSGIVAWNIYRTQSPVFGENSLLVTQSETTTEGGADLVTTYTDTGTSTSQGVPLEQTAVPPAVPQLDAGDIFSALSDPLPANVAPRGVNNMTISLPGTLADATTYHQFVPPHDMYVERMDLFYLTAPTGADGSNYITVRVKDDSLVDEVQSLYTDAVPADELQVLYNDATSGTFTLSDGVDTTTAIDFDALAGTIKTRLETDITSITGVTVVGDGTVTSPWYIYFDNPGGTNVTELIPGDGSLVGGTSTIVTNIQGSDGGTFTLSDGTDTTSAIAYDATGATIKTRLETDITSITTVSVTGTGTSSDPWLITFENPGDQDVDLLQVNYSTTLNGIAYIAEVTKGRGNSQIDLDVTSNVQAHSFTTPSSDFGSQEAEDATISGGTQVSDTLALNDVAVELDAQNEYVYWNIGTLDAGTYIFKVWASKPDASSTADFVVFDLNASTLATLSIPAGANEAYEPNYEIEVTLDGTEDVELRFTKTDATTDRIRVDKMEYEVVLPRLYGGQTVTVEVVVTGTPTTNGDDAQFTIWY